MLLNVAEKKDIFEMYGTGNWTKAGLARAYNVSARTIGRVIDQMETETSTEAVEEIDVPETIGSYYFDSTFDNNSYIDDFDEVESLSGDNDYDYEEDDPSYSHTIKGKYNVVATRSTINIYLTSDDHNETASISKHDDESLFNEVMTILRNGIDNQYVLQECFDTIHIKTRIETVTLDHIHVVPTHGKVYYQDGNDRVEFSGGLVDRIIKLVILSNRDELDGDLKKELKGLSSFANKLKNNPSKRAVDELYDFIKHSDIIIREDGMVECYKRVRGDFMDIYSGTMDNSVGNILEVPYESVDPDSNNTCSHGLHVCSKTYLPYYGTTKTNVVLKVIVDPADFVAIPSDYNQPVIGCDENQVAPSKARVCRYEVVGVATDVDLL